MADVFQYSVFGGRLASEIPFPQLRAVEPADADWTLRVVSESDATDYRRERGDGSWPGTALVGELTVLGLRIRVFSVPGGLRIDYSDTGSFDITAGGREIVWRPADGAKLEDARDCVIGRVFATVLHIQGLLCLHGSAVAIDGRAVAFLAPQFHGKSTLALAISDSGGRLISDDCVAVTPDARPLVLPGVHSVRLFADSADRLQRVALPVSDDGTAKRHVSDLADERLAFDRTPLAAIYLLAPTSAMPIDEPARRTRLTGTHAAVALLSHLKVGELLGRDATHTHMMRAVTVASATPVYALDILRDFSRLDEVVAQLNAWHGAPAREPIAAAR
ncbi:MAG: hypothetical protein ABJD07_14495 [Gemmatimonadaceae bacterium]